MSAPADEIDFDIIEHGTDSPYGDDPLWTEARDAVPQQSDGTTTDAG